MLFLLVTYYVPLIDDRNLGTGETRTLTLMQAFEANLPIFAYVGGVASAVVGVQVVLVMTGVLKVHGGGDDD